MIFPRKMFREDGRTVYDETTSPCEDRYCNKARLRHSIQEARECHNKAMRDAGN